MRIFPPHFYVVYSKLRRGKRTVHHHLIPHVITGLIVLTTADTDQAIHTIHQAIDKLAELDPKLVEALAQTLERLRQKYKRKTD